MKSHFAIALLLCTLQLTALHARVLTQGKLPLNVRVACSPTLVHLGVRAVLSLPLSSPLSPRSACSTLQPSGCQHVRFEIHNARYLYANIIVLQASSTLHRQLFAAFAGSDVSLLHPGRQVLASSAAAAAASAAGDAAAAAAAAASEGLFLF